MNNLLHPNFVRPVRFGLAALGLALLTACDPVDVIRWSPDGQHAIVQGAKGEFLVDATGKILGEARGTQVWMPDSRTAVGVRSVDARNWAEYAALLGPDRSAEVVSAAEQLLPIVQHYAGDWDKFDEDPAEKQWTSAHPKAALGATIYYLTQIRADAIAEAAAKWRAEGKEHDSINIPIYELILRSVLPQAPPTEKVLLRSADAITFVLPSPQGKDLAFVRSLPDSPSLEIIPSEGGETRAVAGGPEQADWTPDGQQLVYAKPDSPPKGSQTELLLGTITRQRVCDGDGGILATPEATEDLAGIIFVSGSSRVACLPDGRILFASLVMQLPALNKDMPKEVTLFALRPGETPALERVISEAAQKKLPSRIDHFVLSPDARRIAIPGDGGEIAVFSLESGEVTTLQEKGWKFNAQDQFTNHVSLSPVAPSWRSADELCYVAAMPDRGGLPQRAEMALRKLGGEPRTISESWSDLETDTFLPKLKPAAPAPAESAPARAN